jgi:hypothetical protein
MAGEPRAKDDENVSKHGRQSGIPVDAYGGSTVDPTKNVLDLVEAANKRQDDLRQADVKRIDTEILAFKEHLKELMAAHDKRYEQRYEAQQKALDAAFTAQKDAVNTAMVAQKEAGSNALAAQDRAVAKAETAAEKRFEGADKARLEQAEQQRTLMPRAEAESRFAMLSEKVGVLEGFRTESLSKGSGTKEGYGMAIGSVALILTILSILAAIVMFVSRLGGP